jgi:hypothetical protein
MAQITHIPVFTLGGEAYIYTYIYMLQHLNGQGGFLQEAV